MCLVFCFISMKTPRPFIWGIIYFCTLNGFFRILEKTSSELICTWLGFNYRYTPCSERDSCTSGGDLCSSGYLGSGEDSESISESTHDDASTHSTPSKMVKEGVVDFKNEISNMEMVIIVSFWKSFLFT